MSKTKLYIYTLLGISLLVAIIGFGSFKYAYKSAKDHLWNSKMESGERECREIGKLLGQELESGIPSQEVIEHLQRSIVNTDTQSEFLCMYNKKGVQLCHPNTALIGQKIYPDNSNFALNNKSAVAFSDILHSGKEISGIRSFSLPKKRSSEIVNVYPVQGSDWVVATHFNIEVIEAQLDSLYKQFLVGLFIMALLLISSCFLLIRLIYHRYEKRMESEIDKLNLEVNELTTLNKQLIFTQEKSQGQIISGGPVAIEDENPRKRLVTYQNDEMILLDMQDIALFSLEDETIFIYTFFGKRFTINLSLEEVMKQVDNHLFYRANRQYIININSIKTILIYGKNQLHLVTKPESKGEIIISKNKVAEFKKWIDQ